MNKVVLDEISDNTEFPIHTGKYGAIIKTYPNKMGYHVVKYI